MNTIVTLFLAASAVTVVVFVALMLANINDKVNQLVNQLHTETSVTNSAPSFDAELTPLYDMGMLHVVPQPADVDW